MNGPDRARPSRRHVLTGLAVLAGTGIATLAGRPASAGHDAAGPKVPMLDAPTTLQKVRNGEIFLIDIRTPEEWAETGVAEGAIPLDMRDKAFIRRLLELRAAAPARPMAFICATGGRSGYVTRFLAKNGLEGVLDVPEGMLGSRKGPGWLKRGLPVAKLSQAEIDARLAAALATN